MFTSMIKQFLKEEIFAKLNWQELSSFASFLVSVIDHILCCNIRVWFEI